MNNQVNAMGEVGVEFAVRILGFALSDPRDVHQGELVASGRRA